MHPRGVASSRSGGDRWILNALDVERRVKQDTLSCPHCHANLSPATLRSNESTVCPFCERDVSGVLDEWEASPGFERTSILDPESATSPGLHRPLPRGSRLEIQESTRDRISLTVPTAWSAPHNGRIKLFFLSLSSFYMILAFFYQVFILGNDQWVIVVALIPMTLLFPVITIWLGRRFVPNWFRRIQISLERETLTFTTDLWGRRTRQVLPVSSETRCDLSIIGPRNQQDRNPTYEVLVQSGNNVSRSTIVFRTRIKSGWWPKSDLGLVRNRLSRPPCGK